MTGWQIYGVLELSGLIEIQIYFQIQLRANRGGDAGLEGSSYPGQLLVYTSFLSSWLLVSLTSDDV